VDHRAFSLRDADRPHLTSFPTRRSSDLPLPKCGAGVRNPYQNAGWAYETPIKIGGEMSGERRWHATWAMLPDGLARDVVLEADRSEEHTSELQSRENLVCRLLLEKKNHI